MDLSRIPTADLEALQAGDLSKVSTQTLNYMQRASSPTSQPKATQPAPQDNTPEWAGKHPNLYGMYGAGRELLRTGIETAGATAGAAGGAFIPIPGSSVIGGGIGYAGGKRAANAVLGEDIDTSAMGIGKDVALGGIMTGVGKAISMIPGVNKILSPSQASIGTKPVGTGVLNKTSSSMMEKSLKVPPSSVIGGVKVNREKAIETALDNGIPITKGGLKRVQGLIDDLGEQMDAVVAENPNAIIKTDSVLEPVKTLKDWASKTVNGEANAKKIDRVIKSFKEQYGDEITVAQAQEIKRNTNAFLKKSYGELKPVTEEATKQIVRGLKDRIAEEIPEIAGVNLKYGEMKNLERVLERAVNRTGNWDWFSLSAGMAGTIVGGATGNVMKATEAVAFWRLMKSPIVQSHLALMLKKAGKGKEANAMAMSIADSIYNKINPESQGVTRDY
jgi:hypothetical protein